MKRFNKKYILILMLIGVFLITGCSKFNFSTFSASDKGEDLQVTSAPENNSDNIKSTETADVKVKNDITDKSSASVAVTTTADSITPTPTAVQPTENMELPIYIVDAENGDIVPVTPLIPKGSEVTPELIVDKVIESMADQSIIIGTKNVTTKDDAIIVNFDKDKTPYKNLGSGYEAAILDAIAQSLIDNLDTYNKVIYRVDDGPYVSGVFELGIDEVYFER
ncbi:MAG TPA: GerMN domain-containing protein [Mobilitalea sp.]|nr:GerMN domain-containing protein [Mobilitalea sp.]